MNDPNRLMKWILILGLIVLAVVALYPPHRKLKAGIDLAGGTSLLLEIDTTGLSPSEQTGMATRVMNILKDRVDPKGQLNLEWRPVGNTRLEIRMPRPPKEAVERRKLKEAALDALAEKNLRRFDVEEALNSAPDRRDTALAALVRGVTPREPLIETLKAASDEQAGAIASADQTRIETATTAYQEAMEGLLATNLPINRLTDILALGPGDERGELITRLRDEYPSFDISSSSGADARLMTKALEAYDAWTEDKADLEDPSDLKRRIKGAGVLEFRILAERDPSNPTSIVDSQSEGSRAISRYTDQLAKRGPRSTPGDRHGWYLINDPLKFTRTKSVEELDAMIASGTGTIISAYAGKYYVLAFDTPGYRMLRSSSEHKWKLKRAYADRDPMSGQNTVNFALDTMGGQSFGKLTGDNVAKQLCIMLDNAAVSHATINERITTSCQITGQFTLERVQDLVRTLEAGSLPARLKETPLAEKTIGPALGETNRTKGLNAAIWGVVAVAVFVLLYYGIAAGGMANLALALNLLFLLGVMALLQATFTLPGIAGVILTVGMAIDANVLIFERIREERNRGVVFKKALNAGYDKAFSTIMDANLTTLLTCIILGFVGSEEVKGFAITLGIGIVTSMFTALFVTRLIFNTLISGNLLKDLHMRAFIGVPSVDWLSLRGKFWPMSTGLVIAGAGVFVYFSTTNTESVYDIEFLGGTSVQLDLKPNETLNDEEVRQLITGSGNGDSASGWLVSAADAMGSAQAGMGSTSRHFTLTSSGGGVGAEQLGSLMRGVLDRNEELERDGIIIVDRTTVEFETKGEMTLDRFKERVAEAGARTREAAGRLASARVQSVKDLDSGDQVGSSFEVVTIANRHAVQEAILATMGDKLAAQKSVKHEVVQDTEMLNEPYFVVEAEDSDLRDVIGGDTVYDVRRFRGGVAVHVVLDAEESPIQVVEVERRLRELVLQVDAEHYRTRETAVFPIGEGSKDAGYKAFAVLAMDDSVHYEDVSQQVWQEQLADQHVEQVTAALATAKSLSKVVSFEPQIAGQARNSAVFAIVLALGAIVAYLWLRFGTKEYGLAAIVALVHDVSVTLGLVALSRFVAGTIIGDVFAIEAFRVDLPMIAAVLTVIGYSLNDTIVVFDRIRENRGKIGKLAPSTINTSINQTLSRTFLTSITTFLAVGVLYVWGGASVHGFSFALMIGVIVGTYSSIGIATPLLYRPQVLRNVIAVIVTLAVIGIVHLTVASSMVELILSGVVAAMCLIYVLKSTGGAGYARPGAPAAA